MYTLHTKCRACNYAASGPGGIKNHQKESLIPAFDLGVQPLANDFRNEREEHAGHAPLSVSFCPRCSLAQLGITVRPDILYSNYPYVTSKSQTMREHFVSLWNEILKEAAPESLVEIGSNDGDFLAFAKESGVKNVIGIDPAKNLSGLASNRGLPTICGIFNIETAHSASLSVEQADVIVARHVFAHVDDWADFMRSIAIISGAETLTVIEVPYVVDLLKNAEFDTIYHEHLSYVSIKAIKHLLEPTGFHIHKVIHFPIHGGTIAIMIKRNDTGSEPHNFDESFPESITIDSWIDFSKRAKAKISGLTRFVEDGISRGKTFCGFGASAKSTVWINACGFTKRHLKFVCDCTPTKQYTFSPGSNIPIVDEGALLRELPDVCINFAWNFMDAVLEKNRLYIEKGGKIVSPHLE